MKIDTAIALTQAGYINILSDPTVWGYMWVQNQSSDLVTFVNDMPSDGSGTAPAGSRRAAYLNKIRPFECTQDLQTVNFLASNVQYMADAVTSSHLADSTYLQMVRFPKIYFSFSVKNGYTIILFSEVPHFGFTLIPSFAYARYRGTISGGKLLSYSALQNPSVNVTLINAQSYARAVNAACDVTSCWHWNIMALMMLLDTGRFNAQAIWRGAADASSSYAASIPCGKTNALTTPNGVGASYTVNYSGTDYTVVPFRWRFIENIYGGIWNMAIGGYATHTIGEAFMKLYVAKNRASFNTNYSLTGHDYIGNMPTTQSYVKEFIAGTMFPASVGGGSTTYKCDYYYCDTADTSRTNSLRFGGFSNSGVNSGPFDVNSNWSPSSSSAYVGASLLVTELPEAIAAS